MPNALEDIQLIYLVDQSRGNCILARKTLFGTSEQIATELYMLNLNVFKTSKIWMTTKQIGNTEAKENDSGRNEIPNRDSNPLLRSHGWSARRRSDKRRG